MVEKNKIEKEKEYLKLIEATLFVAGRWMNLQELVAITNINPLLLKMLLSKLKEEYEKKDGAIIITEKENMWKMDIKNEYIYLVGKLATGSSEFSKAEQETLAVIAYKQPIKQSVVVKIRGNKAYNHIKKFIQLGLIRAKKQGHTLELSLTEEFYNYFSLKENNELENLRKIGENISKENKQD